MVCRYPKNETVGVSMNKGVKFRAYPNKEQQNLINQTLGCCRLIYNKGLVMRNDAYVKGQKIGYNQTSAMLTELKSKNQNKTYSPYPLLLIQTYPNYQ